MNKQKKVLLIILDGFGHSEAKENNAVAMAKAPTFERLFKTCPHSLVETSGEAVGLPQGQMGNSEVGHLNIGGGRIIPQELTRIADFARNSGFESLPAVDKLLRSASQVHVFGLLSDGGVHSAQEHLFLLLEAAARVRKTNPLQLHMVTDGRDTPPKSAIGYAQDLEKVLAQTKSGQVATVGGRYFMMDRDKRWDRTQLAYRALTEEGAAKSASTIQEAIEMAYSQGETDEFIKPFQIQGGRRIQRGDALICFNFRADRMRQILSALALDSFSDFPTPTKLEKENVLTFTRYDEKFPFTVLFTPKKYHHLLGGIVSEAGGKQLRIAETEKYAHVTYFFNGGDETPFSGEERILIPSPKDVATYDLKPQMSAYEITRQLTQKMEETDYSLVVLNFANGDMVGHSGNLTAAIKAVEVLDDCLGKLLLVAEKKGFDVLITADHGNSECMVDPVTKAPHTAHTTNPVPFIWVPSDGNKNWAQSAKLKDGILADVAPTVLKLLELPQPAEMTGRSLIS